MKLDVEDLKESKIFLNDLYTNVTTAIFLADEQARLAHFNDAFKALFYKPEDELIGELCGNAMGCSFFTDEGVDCGTTSNCKRCELRSSIIKSFIEHVPVYKMPLVRNFDICGRRLRKHFSFTTKYATYMGEEYVLVLVDDVTELAEAQADLMRRNNVLEATLQTLAKDLIDNSRELVLLKETSQELGREIRHRVGNILQLLSSLLRFEGEDNSIDSGSFKDFTLRLDTIIEAYHHTRYDEGDVKIPLETFIKALTNKTQSCLCPNMDIIDGDQLSISLEIAIPLGLAFVELLSLARRESAGSIVVKLHRENRILDIGIVTETPSFNLFDHLDDGRGEAAGSANIRLASAMIEQLKGKLEFRSPCEALIRLPI